MLLYLFLYYLYHYHVFNTRFACGYPRNHLVWYVQFTTSPHSFALCDSVPFFVHSRYTCFIHFTLLPCTTISFTTLVLTHTSPQLHRHQHVDQHSLLQGVACVRNIILVYTYLYLHFSRVAYSILISPIHTAHNIPLISF